MKPELMRDVLLKPNIFQKTPSHPLVKLLVSGLAAKEPEYLSKGKNSYVFLSFSPFLQWAVSIILPLKEMFLVFINLFCG